MCFSDAGGGVEEEDENVLFLPRTALILTDPPSDWYLVYTSSLE
jgi:hypothetical protein